MPPKDGPSIEELDRIGSDLQPTTHISLGDSRLIDISNNSDPRNRSTGKPAPSHVTAKFVGELMLPEHPRMHAKAKYETRSFALYHANCLPQMRKSIIHDDLEELIDSIDSISPNDEAAENEIIEKYLVNIPEYAVMTPPQTQAYLNVVNDTWKTDVSLDELTQRSDGSYVIVTSGHRRTIATTKIAERRGIFVEEVIIDAQASERSCDTDNPESVAGFIYEILSRQLAENVYSPPSPDRYARILYENYRLYMAAHKDITKAEFRKRFKIGEDRLNCAIKFMELPESIRDLVHKGQLTYGKAVASHTLIEPYIAYLTALPGKFEGNKAAMFAGDEWTCMNKGQKISMCVEFKLQLFCADHRNKKKDDFKSQIDTQVKTWDSEINADGGELFDNVLNARKAQMTAYLKETKRIISEQTTKLNAMNATLNSLPERFKQHSPEELEQAGLCLIKHIGKAISVLVGLHITRGLAPETAADIARKQVMEAFEKQIPITGNWQELSLLVS